MAEPREQFQRGRSGQFGAKLGRKRTRVGGPSPKTPTNNKKNHKDQGRSAGVSRHRGVSLQAGGLKVFLWKSTPKRKATVLSGGGLINGKNQCDQLIVRGGPGTATLFC